MEDVHEVDAVLRVLNPWGRYQVFQLLLTVFDLIPACFAILSAVFTGYIPEFECQRSPEDNVTLSNGTAADWYDYGKCEISHYVTEGNTTTLLETTGCIHGYQYGQENTYAAQWNLVCSRSNYAALAQSLVLGGQGIGAFVMSHLADRYGRKTIHVLSHLGVMATMLVMAFSRDIIMLAVLRLVAGTFQQGIVCTGTTLVLELFPREVRAITEVCGSFGWSIGVMVIAMFGYFFRELDWRILQVGLVCVSCYALVEWWLMEESLRWLLVNGRYKEATRILKKMARWNKVDYTKVEAVMKIPDKGGDIKLVNVSEVATDINAQENSLQESDGKKDIRGALLTQKELEREVNSDSPGKSSHAQETHTSVEKYTIIDILKNPGLRINTLILWYTWICATGTYYGLTLVSSHLAGDRYLNFFLSGVVEMPGLFLNLYLFNKIGRKRTLILWYSVTGASLITATVLLTLLGHIHSVTIIATGFSLVGKMAITGSFNACFLYTPEIYPTNYRNSGLGIASSISRIGGILAPFASNLALIALWIPGAVFGGMCGLVGVLALRLPESMQHELPSTMRECDEWETEKIHPDTGHKSVHSS